MADNPGIFNKEASVAYKSLTKKDAFNKGVLIQYLSQ